MILHGVRFDFALHSSDLIIVLPGARCTSALSVPCPDDSWCALSAWIVAGFVMQRVSPEHRGFPGMRYLVVKGYSQPHLKQEFVVQPHYTLARLLLYSL